MALSRRTLILAIVLAAALLAPLAVKSAFALDILIRILLFAFIGTAWNLLGGYAKQFSLGHAAFSASAPIPRR
jgi:branched-chain amino acid transport system permease protein